MTPIFKDFDTTTFWADVEYSFENYVEAPPTVESIAMVEKELGYKLPASYIELMRTQNGGLVNKTCFPTEVPTSYADDHIGISGLFGIGNSKTYSLCGSLGSKFMIEEWGYPDIGVCICDTPSAGHDLVMLDYSECGPAGEPRVVHIDQEMDFETTLLALTFEAFIRGLISDEVYDTSAADLEEALSRIKSGSFSSILKQFFASDAGHGLEGHVRSLLERLTRTKGYFALHQDDQSLLVYDFQFYIFQKTNGAVTRDAYLKEYPAMIAFSDGDISTKGYAPAYVEDWLTARINDGRITKDDAGGLRFVSSFEVEILQSLKAYN